MTTPIIPFSSTNNSSTFLQRNKLKNNAILTNPNTQALISAIDTGWYDNTGFHDPSNTNYLIGDDDIEDNLFYRNWMTFNLPVFTSTVVSARLVIDTYDFFSEDTSETYQLWDVTTPISTLRGGGSGLTSIYNDLGTGTIYGSRTFTSDDSDTAVTIDLNQNLINALNTNSGGSFALGGLISTLDNVDNSEYIFGFSGDFPATDVQLLITYESDPDNNDFFADRIDLGNVENITVTGTNIGASSETGEPIQSDTINSVWWSWTPTETGIVTINTNGSDFDTFLSIFTGSAVDNLTVVGQDDDSGDGEDSLVTFLAQKGVEYQIAVDGYLSDTGNITLNLDLQPYFGKIEGTIWDDENGNGIQDTGENPLPNWTVYLDDNRNGQLDSGEVTTVTNANGNYLFEDLAPGTYFVAEIIKSGWQQTYPDQINSNSTSFENYATNDVGTKSDVTKPISPDLTANYESGELIVKFKEGISTAEINTLKASVGAKVLNSIDNLGLQLWSIKKMSVAEAIATYGKSNLVEYIEPNYTITTESVSIQATPNDPSYNSQLWGLNNTGQTGGTADADIDAPEAWDITKGSASIIVGVIDTGIDYNHPDLVNNIWTNPGEVPNDGIDNDSNGYIDDVHGYDFAYDDGDPMDGEGHGTHVSGTIGAQGNNGVGVTGVNWNVSLMALKFLDDTGSGNTFDAIEAVNYATMMGVNLTNNSWGGGGFSQALFDAISAAGDAGQLFVAAAGNESNDNDASPSYPASYDLDNIISVAATDDNDELADFSNYGATSVDLAAPGVDIHSTFPNNTYGTISGTSMASPHVAGVAALLWANNPDLTDEEVKAAILSGVDPKSNLTGTNVTGGRLNALNALINSVPVPGTHTVKVVSGETVQGIDFGNQQLTSSVTINLSGNQTVVEGLTSSQNVTYTVTLSSVSTQTITVQYATANGTAIAGADYTATNGTLTFAPGQISKTIVIPIVNNSVNEVNENFTLTLSNPSNGTLGNAIATTTITDTLSTAVTTTLPANVENLTLTGTANINGTGNAGNNIITGNSANNRLDGGDGNDTLIGGSGNDTLSGGNGNDSMVGGVGNDLYGVNATGDRVIENANQGIDTVNSAITYTLGTNLENLSLTGTTAINGTGNTLNNRMTGNSSNNRLDGGDGNDTLIGGSGNDTLSGGNGNDSMVGGVGNDLYGVNTTGDRVIELANQGIDTVNSAITYTLGANLENLTLTGTTAINGTGNTLNNRMTGNSSNNRLDGGDGNDTLIGSSGNDTLSGGNGNDSMVGGVGNDLYGVNTTSDRVIENANQGIDTVNSAITYTLGANLENLTLTGTTAINGTGNTLNNRMTGNSSNNRLDGGDGNDTLIGGSGNDTLSGGNGNDSMVGGAGNDLYGVNTTGDRVIELANQGIDTVNSAITYTLGANLENLTLTGTTAINGTGNTLNNRMTGNSSNNRLDGGDGNDTLIGGSGNDILDGGNGNDSMVGGVGNDIYGVTETTDKVVEAFNGGTDYVNSRITYTLTSNVENLTLTGTANINGTGNTLNNRMTGNSSNNRLDGGDGNDTLIGGSGNDILDGGTGNDSMAGGAGNDIYGVTETTDKVVEAFNGGTDSVNSRITYTLTSNVENLNLTGIANINGTGNTLNNVIMGNSGNNILTGGAGNDTLTGVAGNDTLTGGSGNDFFRFNSTSEKIDRITDFFVLNDTILISRSGFGGSLSTGTLTATQFKIGSSATTSANRFIYNSSNGALFFDVDGNGATSAVQIATLTTGLGMTNQDILVV